MDTHTTQTPGTTDRSMGTPAPRGRRGILAAAAAVAALAAKGVTERQPVAADGGTWTLPYYGASNFYNADGALVSFHVTSILGSVIGVAGYCPNGVGVYGSSTSNTGVQGVSSSGSGVYGSSTSSSGVYGGSYSGYGMYATSTNSYGMYATSTNSYGMYATSTTNYGIVGGSGGNHAIYGNLGTTTAGKAGVYGSGNGAGTYGMRGTNGGSGSIGVHGTATSGYGVVGYAAAGDTAALYGSSADAYAPAFAAYNGVAGGLAGTFNGKVYINGDFVATGGVKSAAVPHPDGSHRLLYCVESPESWFEDFGEGTLTAGKADVRLDPDFAAVVDTSTLHVCLTEHDAHHDLYVTNRSATGFTVAADGQTLAAKGMQASTVAGTFSYRVVAKRKDVAAPRLAKVDLPKVPAPPPPPPPEPKPKAPEPPKAPTPPTPPKM